MGIHANINSHRWPKQGPYLGAPVEVAFNYDTRHTVEGVVVRDDAEEPYRTIIRLANGRYVLATECQWSPLRQAEVVTACSSYTSAGDTPYASGDRAYTGCFNCGRPRSEHKR
jgi:hypothetical protein